MAMAGANHWQISFTILFLSFCYVYLQYCSRNNHKHLFWNNGGKWRKKSGKMYRGNGLDDDDVGVHFTIQIVGIEYKVIVAPSGTYSS